MYDALNQRAKVTSGGVVTRYGFDLNGRRATTWQDGTGALAQAQYYAGGSRLGYWSQSDGNLHFNQQDWVGTERLEVSGTGAVEGSSVSFPFGDNLTLSGTDTNEGHFAMMDHDLGAGSGLEHGTFREYHATSGRWLSPDPYAGSYNFLNPQSLNRYVYALNNPLVFSDPLGLCDPQGIGQNFVGAKGNPRRADLGAEECTTAETPAGTTGTVTMTDSVTVTADPDPPDPIYNPGTDGVGWSLSGSVDDGSDAPSNLTPAQCAAAKTVLAREAQYGTPQAARMSGNTFGDNTLSPFNSTFVPNLQSPVGNIDLDWFTDISGYGGGQYTAAVVYTGAKSIWTLGRVFTGTPVGHYVPFADPGERNAVWQATINTQYADIFTPAFMKNSGCP